MHHLLPGIRCTSLTVYGPQSDMPVKRRGDCQLRWLIHTAFPATPASIIFDLHMTYPSSTAKAQSNPLTHLPSLLLNAHHFAVPNACVPLSCTAHTQNPRSGGYLSLFQQPRHSSVPLSCLIRLPADAAFALYSDILRFLIIKSRFLSPCLSLQCFRPMSI